MSDCAHKHPSNARLALVQLACQHRRITATSYIVGRLTRFRASLPPRLSLGEPGREGNDRTTKEGPAGDPKIQHGGSGGL